MGEEKSTVLDTDVRVAAVLARYANDRVGFVRYIIGVEPKPWQAEALKALDTEDHVVIKSGVNTGKTALLAWLILHYSYTRALCKQICTSPSKDQLHNALWAELNMWWMQLPPLFRDMKVWSKTMFKDKKHDNWFAVARTATKDNPQALAGIHARFVHRYVDEAGAVWDPVFEVLDGDTGVMETKEILTSQALSLSGQFYDAFHKNAGDYRRFTWNCLDMLQSNGGLVPDRLVERIRKKYGEDSNMWKVRVLGDFPTRDGDSFIPFDWVYNSINRIIPDQKGAPIVFGADIARYGHNATVIAIKQGNEFLPYHVLRNKSIPEVARYIAKLANKLKPKMIFVDVIGLGGGVYDILEETGYPVTAVNVAESPALDGKKYRRLRDELWGEFRDLVETTKIKLWDNEEKDLLGQLTTPKYRVTHGGMIIVESKDDMRKRRVDSPDIGDATIMTGAQPLSAYEEEVDEFLESFYGRQEEFEVVDAEAGY